MREIEFARRIIGCGVPVARASRGWIDDARTVPKVDIAGRHLRDAILVEALGPVGAYQSIDPQRLAGFPIDHEQIAIFGRMEDGGADLSVHLDIGQHHRLGRGKVPAVARRFLIMPFDVLRSSATMDER